MSSSEQARFEQSRKMLLILIHKWNFLLNKCLGFKLGRDYLFREIWGLNLKNIQFSSFIFLLTLDRELMLLLFDLYCFHNHMYHLKDQLKVFSKIKSEN